MGLKFSGSSLLLWLEHVVSLVLPTVNALVPHFVSRPTNMPCRRHDHILYGTHGSCPASASSEQVRVIILCPMTLFSKEGVRQKHLQQNSKLELSDAS